MDLKKHSADRFEAPVRVLPSGELVVGWQSPSNIALVKYWGKKHNQLPINPSLSMTLSRSVTRTTVRIKKKHWTSATIELRYFFEGKENPVFQSRVQQFLEKLTGEMPFLTEYSFEIESSNTFPHSAGIASSASSMSVLALCLVSLDGRIASKKLTPDAFYQKASHYARLGSGSACRSVYGNYALWGEFIPIPESGNHFAISLPVKPHALFSGLHDSILIIDRGEKPVSSRAGHEKMNKHPFKNGRIQQAEKNLGKIIKAISSGNWDVFSRVVENEALTLHGLMMSSDPGFMLIQPNTLKVIECIQSFRTQTGFRITFTLDAGPNLHVLYPDIEHKVIQQFIRDELAPYCADNYVLHDRIGEGPVPLDQ